MKALLDAKEDIITSDRDDVTLDEESMLDRPKVRNKTVKTNKPVVDKELNDIDSFLNSIDVEMQNLEYLPCQVKITCARGKDLFFIGKLEEFTSGYQHFETTIVIAIDEFKKIYTTLIKSSSTHNVLTNLDLLTEDTIGEDHEDSSRENFEALPLISNTQEISDILFKITTNEKTRQPIAKLTIRCGRNPNTRIL